MLDALDLEIAEHAKRSRVLKEESEQNRRKAAELAEEEMDDAAKRRLAVYLLCKQLRNNEEAVMADLDAARLQLLMQPDHPTSQTIEKVNSSLRGSVTDRDKTVKALNNLSFITQVNVEQTMTELEGYGIQEKVISAEFAKLKGKSQPAVAKPETLAVVAAGLPEVPNKKSVTNSPAKRGKVRRKETG
ncbi:MAG: hypothetical protein NWF00_08855 [Candidatus Bathyarchaeota archaeon]|nr:hypothetical protein [Candidatus Bathyarchaeota archaeon]